MSGKQTGDQGNAQHNDPSTTLGVGGPTSGEAGATRTHETMAETGGSGGSGLTRNQVGAAQPQEPAGQERKPAKGEDEAADSGKRGFQDTRSHQAGGTDTGLGVPETGANQTPQDLDRQQ
jgi:hypothetical protein